MFGLLLSLLLLCSLWCGGNCCSRENKVLFYSNYYYSTTTCGYYKTYVESLGYTTEIWTDAEWLAASTTDFSKFNAIVFCDPRCQTDEYQLDVAASNNNVWGPAVNGNILILGTDEGYHYSQGGQQVLERGLDFVLDDSDNECELTGLYASLSCYYHGQNENVDMLDYFGTFTTDAASGCFNDAHIVATHPALTGMTDDTLSDWSCSVHEILVDYPEDEFIPLAIALNEGIDDGTGMSFSDGSFGVPYIIANNVDPLCQFDIPECDNDPCDCDNEYSDDFDEQCLACHENGCDLCDCGYFKKDYNYPCTNCNELFGDGCKFCQDFLGCGQCHEGYDRIYEQDCELWYCVESEITCLTERASGTDCSGDTNCNDCQAHGCNSCSNNYWSLSFSHDCSSCSDIPNCSQCNNWQGCTQCNDGYQVSWSNECGFGYCSVQS